MHDHGTESHGHVLVRVTRGNTSGMCIETRFNMFQSVSSQTNTHYWYIVQLVSVSSSQHGLKQIKLCFNSHAGCEFAPLLHVPFRCKALPSVILVLN